VVASRLVATDTDTHANVVANANTDAYSNANGNTCANAHADTAAADSCGPR